MPHKTPRPPRRDPDLPPPGPRQPTARVPSGPPPTPGETGAVFGCFVMLLAFVALIGYGVYKGFHPSPSKPDEGGRYEIEALYVNEPGIYSVATQENGLVKVNALNTRYSGSDNRVILVADVPEDRKNYVVWHHHFDDKPWCNVSDETWDQTVHIHSASDLQGAGWDHGKGGQGTTIRIQ